jgi:hypothetical protein
MNTMEFNGRVRHLGEGWVCECPGTRPGFGATPEAAWHEWLQLLPLPPEEETCTTQ